MSEITKYLDVLKEIENFSKDLDKDIVISIINQFGIDSRLKGSSIKSTEPIKQPEFIPCTESQIKELKRINKFTEGLSKSEAWNIISDSKKIKEQEY